MECPAEQQLSAWISGRLALHEAETLRAHLAACDACRLVADVLQSDRPVTEPSLKPGQRVGPYLVLEWLGAGGMGAVYAAYDARLDRRLALKVLERGEGQHHVSVMHEARAMARLNHPNVATVYDVGERDGLKYLAMELLPNGTLREWLRGAPRPLEELLAVFAGIARGLAHAHAHGLVHRDFKPDNVLFTADGTPRVADFGLATAEPKAGAARASEVAGTWAYLAPETLRGAPPTALADQFAFGVTLQKALERLARPAPRALSALVARLQAPEPGRRFESMEAVEAALQRERPSARARRRLRVSAALGLPVVLALALAVTVAHEQRCARAGEPIDRLWAALAPALDATVGAEVGEQLRAWRTQTIEACSTGAEARQRCLATELQNFGAQTESLERAGSLREALKRLEALPSPHGCDFATAGEAQAWDRENSRKGALLARLEAARTDLGVLHTLLEQLKPEQDRTAWALALAAQVELEWPDRTICSEGALEALQSLVSASRRAVLPALESRAWTDLAHCQRQRGAIHQAEFSLAVADEALRGSPAGALARQLAALHRGNMLVHLAHYDDAGAALARVQASGPWLTGMLLSRRALLALAQQDAAAAITQYQQALPLLESAFGPDDRETRIARHNLASSLTAGFRYEEALVLLLRAADEAGGEEAVNTPLASDLVPVLLALGRDAEALRWGRRALEGVPQNDLRTISSMGQQLQAWARAELAAGDKTAVLERLQGLRALETYSDAHQHHVVERRALEAEALIAVARDRPKLERTYALRALGLLHGVGQRARTQASAEARQMWAKARTAALLQLGRPAEAARMLDVLPLDEGFGLDPKERAGAWLAVAKGYERQGQRAQAAELVKQVEPYVRARGL